MAEPDTAKRALRRARRCLRAARLVLADPRTEAEGALVHVAAGWAQLRAAVELGTGMRGTDRATLEQTVSALRSQAEAYLKGEADELPSRREARAQLRLLARAVRAARRQHEPAVRRWLRWAAAIGVLAAIGIAVAVGVGVVQRGVHSGWRGAYYPERGFEGEPVVRQDGRLDFRWGKAAPVRDGPADGFSVRWDGCLDLEQARELELRLGSDDGSRAYVDGEEVVDNWGGHGMRWRTGYVELSPGPHHLRVEYFDARKAAAVALELRGPGLPSERLSHGRLWAPPGPLDADDPCGTGAPTVPQR